MWFIPASNLPWQIGQNVSAKTLKLSFFFYNSLFFGFYFALRALYCIIICVPLFSLQKIEVDLQFFFREQVSCVQIFMASKKFYFDQQKLLFGLIVFLHKRDMDRD